MTSHGGIDHAKGMNVRISKKEAQCGDGGDPTNKVHLPGG